MYSVIVTAEKKGRREGLEEGLAQGLAQGLEKGLAQGREEERLSAARKMKSKGIDDVVISEVTGLTFEEISVL